ncbi:uncharacterized protein PHALS_15256 [Plasmopara halstedii]|uniref:Uncharacterized protein n=1 Tax=Plasmopara halstedii TaxID=4781 RepID=A0A0N7L8K0_PLAHL|nr:uncharacterized protein PHALS_15256 [Plasmopara halstedii]CEG50091.1 hypothetical protein PHALS_15256 [Plasmopara halstedii]|eukprot:XP_024586460.1 hypothetical protein PHALS_15256 [Plasmopara halstedii]
MHGNFAVYDVSDSSTVKVDAFSSKNKALVDYTVGSTNLWDISSPWYRCSKLEIQVCTEYSRNNFKAILNICWQFQE